MIFVIYKHVHKEAVSPCKSPITIIRGTASRSILISRNTNKKI